MNKKVLEDFYLLSDYLYKDGRIKDSEKYKKDFSAFLLHAGHIKAYDFVAPFCRDKKVLDIGCFIGYGETRLSLQAKEIIAIDTDDRVLEFARKNRVVPNVKFQKVDARRLPFPKETFDIVIAFQLLEHIPKNEARSFLSEVKNVLKRKGLLFITTPNRKFRLMPFQRPFNPEHYQEFTAKSLLKILKTTFGDVKIMGIRTKEWIEKIEKERVGKSFCRAYIREPLNMILPVEIKKPVQKIKSKIIKLLQGTESQALNGDEQFNNLFQKFSMNDFYLEKRRDLIEKSLNLFAICKK